jgi:hypothetical protein
MRRTTAPLKCDPCFIFNSDPVCQFLAVCADFAAAAAHIWAACGYAYRWRRALSQAQRQGRARDCAPRQGWVCGTLWPDLPGKFHYLRFATLHRPRSFSVFHVLRLAKAPLRGHHAAALSSLRASLQGDIVFEVDHEDVYKKEFQVFAKLIQGPIGTFVEVKVFKNGDPNNVCTYPVIPCALLAPTVTARSLPVSVPGVGVHRGLAQVREVLLERTLNPEDTQRAQPSSADSQISQPHLAMGCVPLARAV